MMDKTLFVIGWAVVATSALHMLPVTRLVYNPEKVEIVGDRVTMYRSFPLDKLGLPRPMISYHETIAPVTPGHNGGKPCEDSGGPFQYSSPDPVAEWDIDWGENCITDPQGFVWAARWYWHIGALRLGPVDFQSEILRSPCQYRISSRGVVHGPDSPHWAQTSNARCFSTRAAAEAALE